MLGSRFLLLLGSLVVTSVAGCAAEAETFSPSTSDDAIIALPSLGGTFTAKPDAWRAPFRRLELTSELVAGVGGGRRFRAEMDNLATCLIWTGLDPCPSTVLLEGVYASDHRSVTLESSTANPKLRPFLGRYDFTLSSGELSLTRDGFAQTLDRDPCSGQTEAACTANPACDAVFGPSACTPDGLICTADLTFERCEAK